MNLKLIFRILIILSILLPIIGITHTELTMDSQTQEVQDLLEWDGYAGIYWSADNSDELTSEYYITLGILALLLILIIVGLVGMYLFKKWGRTLTVVLTIISICSIALMGVTVALPTYIILNDISNLFFGAIICMSFLEPINNEFNI